MKPETWNRLDKLFAETRAEVGRPLVVAEDQPRQEEISAAENQLGSVFDQDYAEFLRRYGGATVGSMPVLGLRPVAVWGFPGRLLTSHLSTAANNGRGRRTDTSFRMMDLAIRSASIVQDRS